MYEPIVRYSIVPDVKVKIATFYMSNVDKSVVDCQKTVFDKFGLAIDQVFNTEPDHAGSIDKYIKDRYDDFDFIILFDIDAIPLHADAIPTLLHNSMEKNMLVGIAQQSNHLNDDHPYAGPSCTCFSKSVFEHLGKPSFSGTSRSDVGEELTWLAQERNVKVGLLWPTSMDQQCWKLGKDKFFGFGTIYEDLIYHAFWGRISGDRFTKKCKEVLDGDSLLRD